jgi:glycosyltransferase involved in cell wall biosynthesis
MPSRKEGLPYALLEALAAAMPIIATEVGAMPNVLANGRAGLLVPPGAAGDITVSVNSLLDSHDLRDRLARTSVSQMNRNYSLKQMGEATLSCYIR